MQHSLSPQPRYALVPGYPQASLKTPDPTPGSEVLPGVKDVGPRQARSQHRVRAGKMQAILAVVVVLTHDLCLLQV